MEEQILTSCSFYIQGNRKKQTGDVLLLLLQAVTLNKLLTLQKTAIDSLMSGVHSTVFDLAHKAFLLMESYLTREYKINKLLTGKIKSTEMQR